MNGEAGWRTYILVVDVVLIALFAATAAIVDAAIIWVLLGMMLMRLSSDYGYWRRGRP